MKFFELYDVFNVYDAEDIQENIDSIREECKDGLFEEIKSDLISAKEISSDYCTVIETNNYWLINIHTGLGYAQYPKDNFTLDEALNDQLIDEH